MGLLGNEVAAPSTMDEAMAWAQASAFLSERIQKSAADCDGRKADMSSSAANEMRAVLTQLNLKRVGGRRQAAVESVDAMLRELCSRLFGNKKSEPSMSEVRVWQEAASFLGGRIQGKHSECPGREADMSFGAATAMRVVLAQLPNNQTKTISATAKMLQSAIG